MSKSSKAPKAPAKPLHFSPGYDGKGSGLPITYGWPAAAKKAREKADREAARRREGR